MFWQSVWEGFLILLNWRIWICVLIYGAIIYFQYSAFMNKVIKTDEQDRIIISGFSFLTYKAFLESTLITFLTAFILPILFGENSFAPFTLIREMFWPLILLSLILTSIKLLLISTSSFKGAFSKEGDSFAFFLCIGVILIITHGVFSSILKAMNLNIAIYPSFWICLLFFLLSIPILLVFFFAAGLFSLLFNEETKRVGTNIISAAGSLIMGIVFMAMYCAYITESVKSKMPKEEGSSTYNKIEKSMANQ